MFFGHLRSKDGPKVTGKVARKVNIKEKMTYCNTVTGALFREIGFEIGSRDVFW